MGGGGHGHGPVVPKLPDYKIYNKVEQIPELMILKKALAAKGLKDPWIRNEVWRFDRTQRGSPKQIFYKTAGRGIWYGLGLAIVTTIIGKVIEKNDDHGHGGHH